MGVWFVFAIWLAHNTQKADLRRDAAEWDVNGIIFGRPPGNFGGVGRIIFVGFGLGAPQSGFENGTVLVPGTNTVIMFGERGACPSKLVWSSQR